MFAIGRGDAFRDNRMPVALLLLAAILFCTIGRWDLRGPDEPRYAQVAREMIESGNYFVPHLNGQIYSEKPPLFFWLVAGSSILIDRNAEGPSAYAARFPSALAGLGTLAILYFFSRSLYGSTVALWSILILFTTPQFASKCLDAHLDSTLTFWIISALFLFFRGLTSASHSRRKHLSFLFAYVAMGMGVLTKGPVGFIVPMMTVVLYLLIRRNFHELKEIRPFLGMLIVLSVVALWLVPAFLFAGPDYLKIMLFKQNIGRAVNSFAHKQPFYYYLATFPGDFMPWTLFIPSACIQFWRKKRDILKILLPLIWFVGPFVFFSLVSGKRSLYLLPLFPAVSILIAKFWADEADPGRVDSRDKQVYLISFPCYLLFGGMVVLAFMAMLFPRLLMERSTILLQIPLAVFNSIGILTAATGAFGIFLLVTRYHLQTVFYLIVAFVASVVVVGAIYVSPALDATYSLRPFAERVKAVTTPSTPVVATFHPELLNYFLHRYPIRSIQLKDAKIEMEATPGLLVLHKTKDQAALSLLPGVVVRDMAVVGHYTYYILSKAPAKVEAPKRMNTERSRIDRRPKEL
jgi:4-amino-4-deoxy-L-arabinose transferase-like glycosyltransferase